MIVDYVAYNENVSVKQVQIKWWTIWKILEPDESIGTWIKLAWKGCIWKKSTFLRLYSRHKDV